MPEFISAGKILNFHGIQGEAKVGFSKNQQEFFSGLKEVFLGSDHVPAKIARIRFHKNSAIVKFEGINSIEALLPYKGSLIFVEKDAIREALGEDEFLIDELTGLDVFDQTGQKIGFVAGVSNNGATDLLSVKTPNGKISLIPFVKAIVTDVNLKEKRVTINKLEGLLDDAL